MNGMLHHMRPDSSIKLNVIAKPKKDSSNHETVTYSSVIALEVIDEVSLLEFLQNPTSSSSLVTSLILIIFHVSTMKGSFQVRRWQIQILEQNLA
jgi:hypothetical protein